MFFSKKQQIEKVLMKKIYLAGPMDFATEEQQYAWRKQATNKLLKHGMDTLDPTRRPHDCDLNIKEIFKLDLKDIEECELVLADCRQLNIPTFGTSCEVFYASYILKKPVIGWYDEHEPPSGKSVFQEVLYDRKFGSLNKALDHIIKFYV